MGLTMTAATIGLILGGIIGGPVAERLIRRVPVPSASAGTGTRHGHIDRSANSPVDPPTFLCSLTAALGAVVAGQAIARLTEGGAITIPAFLWCLVAGLFIRNFGAAIGVRLADSASELIGSVCLSLFLTWTM